MSSNFQFTHHVTSAWRETLKHLLLRGYHVVDEKRPSGSSREHIGYGLTISPHSEFLVHSPRRAPSLSWACMEVLWYLGLDNDVDPLLLLAPGYERFVEPGTREAHGGYGRRLMHNVGHDMAVDGKWSQLGSVYDILSKDPNSRQAIVTLWDSQDLAMHGKRKDLPCTLTLQFLVRGGCLEMQASMRSNDAWIGFIYDTFAYRIIQRLMADALKLKVGYYHHVVGSMHLYDKNAEAVEELLCDEVERPQGTSADFHLEQHEAWNIPVSFGKAWDMVFKSYSSPYLPLDHLMLGAAKRDRTMLQEVVDSPVEDWFDLIIQTAAKGCLEKLPC